MIRDLRVTREAIARAVEKYGSVFHLAEAIGVAPDRMRAWLRGEEEVPLEYYAAILDALAGKDD